MSADFWAGYISGAAGIIIGNPLDLLKVRLQAESSPLSTNTAAQTSPLRTSQSYASQFTTATSLIRGAAAPILGYGALNALLFVSYNRTASFLTNGSLYSIPSAEAPATLTTTWIAGAIGGLATWVVSTPTELIKCRAQMSNTPISSLGITNQVIRSEGLRGLYLGGTVTALRDSIGYGFYFWAYELGTRWMASTTKTEGKDSGVQEAAKVLLCGGVAGVVTWASVFPLDVIKTRVQTQPTSRSESAPLLVGPARATQPSESAAMEPQRRLGAIEIAKAAYRREGMGVFFRGLTICSVRAFIVNAAQWAVYEWIMRELRTSTTIPNDKEVLR
ncbi:solute carrier family 25 member 45 [Xylogone sp. PMI_703]|nr:solute carrier family 25 member 45 [Xylogone sp. PMI_703]